MIKDSIQKLKQIKEDIKRAIINKGGEANDDFSSYPESISRLNKGTLVVPNGLKFSKSTLEYLPAEYNWSTCKDREDFSYIFSECRNLKEFPSFDVDNATTLEYAYAYCGDGTTGLDISHWNNLNHPNVEYMFAFSNFKSIKWPKNFKVDDMNNMFTNYAGKELDITGLDISDVTSMQYTFYNSDFEKLKLGDLSKVKSLRHTFEWCQKLLSLDAINTTSVTDTADGFRYLDKLRDFGGCQNLSANVEFEFCYNLSYESLLNILNGLSTVTNNRTITFDQYNVDMLTDQDIAIAINKGWSVRPAKSVTQKVNVTSLSQVPSSLARLHPRVYEFSSFTGKWGDESALKSNLPNINSLKNAEIDLNSTTDASYMFADSYVYYVTLNGTSNVTSLKGAFYDAPFIEMLTITGDVSNLVDVTDMFYNVKTKGTFYYNPQYDYSKIINILPEGWVAKPIE